MEGRSLKELEFPPTGEGAQRFNLEVLARVRVAMGKVLGIPVPELGTPPNPLLYLPLGAFFTLTRSGILRGCLGRFPESGTTLLKLIEEFSPRVLYDDPRFPPVERSEAGELELEISIVYAFERIEDPWDFQVGVHGLLVEGEGHGTLLPQVAKHHKLDQELFLRALAEKAGISFPQLFAPGRRFFRYRTYSIAGPLLPD